MKGRTGETEGRKQGRKTLVDQSTGLDWNWIMDYGNGYGWNVFLGWHMANHWRPDCFFVFFLFSLSQVGLSLAVFFNCLTYLLVFFFLFFLQ